MESISIRADLGNTFSPKFPKLQRNSSKSIQTSTISCSSIKNEDFRKGRHSIGDKDGMIIVDHGSRRQESNLMLNGFVAMFKAKTGSYPVVGPAHMSAPESILETHELVGMTLEYRRECGKDSVLQSDCHLQ